MSSGRYISTEKLVFDAFRWYPGNQGMPQWMHAYCRWARLEDQENEPVLLVPLDVTQLGYAICREGMWVIGLYGEDWEMRVVHEGDFQRWYKPER